MIIITFGHFIAVIIPQNVILQQGDGIIEMSQFPQKDMNYPPMLSTFAMVTHSNHMTSSKRADTFIWHTTMRRNPINFLYNPGHVTL